MCTGNSVRWYICPIYDNTVLAHTVVPPVAARSFSEDEKREVAMVACSS